jgi:NAD(P)-dependent dehydrogenase (short-subunit alcohol dehydrogenase family)
MGTIAITGSAGGIGIATRKMLEAAGHHVIGVDLRDAEVIADLATADGRQKMVAEVAERSNQSLDGLVAGAGIIDAPDDHVMSTNFFGAVATLEGLRPLLAEGDQPSAVAITSNSATVFPGLPTDAVEAALRDDEPAARAAAAAAPGTGYPSSKLALARWVRRHAVTPDWAEAGIRLNAVSPGLIDTPMNDGRIDEYLAIGDLFPVPQRRAAHADEIAEVLAFMLSPKSSFMCGSVVYADGGSDAALRADDWPAPLG